MGGHDARAGGIGLGHFDERLKVRGVRGGRGLGHEEEQYELLSETRLVVVGSGAYLCGTNSGINILLADRLDMI